MPKSFKELCSAATNKMAKAVPFINRNADYVELDDLGEPQQRQARVAPPKQWTQSPLCFFGLLVLLCVLAIQNAILVFSPKYEHGFAAELGSSSSSR